MTLGVSVSNNLMNSIALAYLIPIFSSFGDVYSHSYSLWIHPVVVKKTVCVVTCLAKFTTARRIVATGVA